MPWVAEVHCVEEVYLINWLWVFICIRYLLGIYLNSFNVYRNAALHCWKTRLLNIKQHLNMSYTLLTVKDCVTHSVTFNHETAPPLWLSTLGQGSWFYTAQSELLLGFDNDAAAFQHGPQVTSPCLRGKLTNPKSPQFLNTQPRGDEEKWVCTYLSHHNWRSIQLNS